MISDKDIRLWARNKISDDSSLDLDSFVWQNHQSDTSGLESFYQERYQVTQENISSTEESVKWGILFYDVIVDKGAGTTLQDAAAETLADIFDPANNKEQPIKTGIKINIDSATTGTLSDLDENRVQLPVAIEFRAYETTAT